MIKHKNEGNGIITVVDDECNHHTFTPGKIITLNRTYHRFEKYKIFPMEEEKIEIKNKKKSIKINKEED